MKLRRRQECLLARGAIRPRIYKTYTLAHAGGTP
jgi:hypothetical protein